VEWQQEKRILFCRSNAGMSLKTKDRRGKGGRKAGMSLIAKGIIA
jgi:hypothetical protein